MRIGLVDLDTSHPPSWVPILRELGHEVVGVFDHGDVHPPGYADQFIGDHDIPKVFESLDAMVDKVDGAIVHSCNWDAHVDRARPFIEAGKSVLVDKPVAGRAADLRQFEQWASQGCRVTGGSVLRSCEEVAAFHKQAATDQVAPHTALCGCAVDNFNYGIHAYSMLAAVMGADAARVRLVSDEVQRRVEIEFRDKRVGWLVVGESGQWVPFHSTIVTPAGCTQIQVDSGRVYRSFLESVMPYLAGEIDTSPFPVDGWLAPEWWALAAEESAQNQGRWVGVDGSAPGASYDGAEFAESYRRIKAAS